MNGDELVLHVEAALLSAGRPLRVDELIAMFEGREDAPDRHAVRDAIETIAERWRGHALEVSEVASGFRAQIRKEFSQPISVLWQERPARYSRALLETLALIAYRQPASRGEIEEIRGVSVSGSIMKTLLEHEWVRVVGHREAPGRPALYGTTKHFLDAFNLKSLEALPPLKDLKDLEDPQSDLFAGLREPSDAGEDPEPSGASVAVEAGAVEAGGQPETEPEPEPDERPDLSREDASVAAEPEDSTTAGEGQESEQPATGTMSVAGSRTEQEPEQEREPEPESGAESEECPEPAPKGASGRGLEDCARDAAPPDSVPAKDAPEPESVPEGFSIEGPGGAGPAGGEPPSAAPLNGDPAPAPGDVSARPAPRTAGDGPAPAPDAGAPGGERVD